MGFENIDFEGQTFEEEMSSRELMNRLEESDRSYGYLDIPMGIPL